MDTLLNEKNLAARLSLSVATLRAWRLKGYGPKWCKLGSAVRYAPADVEAWLSSCQAGGGR
jgi:predicted DNA-binding transcriptional regulator AlpA